MQFISHGFINILLELCIVVEKMENEKLFKAKKNNELLIILQSSSSFANRILSSSRQWTKFLPAVEVAAPILSYKFILSHSENAMRRFSLFSILFYYY